jgi:uncharacterized membrane protein YbhN (UPF0104 family)
MKKLHTALLVLGAGFLLFLVWRIGLEELWRELVSLGWGLVPLVLAEGVAEMIHTVGWRQCLSEPHRSLPWAFLFRTRMAGYAISYVTPTATLGGEVTKAALLASHRRGPEAVSGVLIGKVCFALGHLLFVVVGSAVVLWRVKLPPALFGAMLLSSGLVASGIAGFFLLQKHGKLGGLVRWLAARKVGGRVMEKAAQDITAVDEALKAFYRERPEGVLLAVCWHLLGDSVGIVQAWLFFSLLKQDASLTTAASSWFLGMWFDLLTFAVPFNLGALEGTRIVALKAIGYNALVGMTYGVMLRLALLFWTGFGLVSYGVLASRIRSDPSHLPTALSCAERRRIP